jgi:phosphate transport system substrate-binding protein
MRILCSALVALSVCALPMHPGQMPAHAGGTEFTITGSTQMYTLGALLAQQYTKLHPNVTIGVQPSSSTFGFDNSCTGATQIGMSDVYILDDQLRELDCGDMIGIPVAISATCVVYNLPGSSFKATTADKFTLVHPVKLTAAILSGIYRGTIKTWNDPAIKALNPGMSLPSARIRAFNTAEPGGSGFVFDQWLALSDAAWNKAVGVSLQPSWPVGFSTGTPSSGTMVQQIQNTPYSIGFVGFDYAISNKLQAAALKNASGVFHTPSLNGLSVAINDQIQQGLPGDFRRTFVTVTGKDAFNPADFEFFVVHRDLTQKFPLSDVRAAMKAFLAWAVDSNGGQKFIEQIEFRKVGNANAQELAHGFIPVPDALRQAIQAQVQSIKD